MNNIHQIFANAVSLNNVGINLIEQGSYREASHRLREATNLIRIMFHHQEQQQQDQHVVDAEQKQQQQSGHEDHSMAMMKDSDTCTERNELLRVDREEIMEVQNKQMSTKQQQQTASCFSTSSSYHGSIRRQDNYESSIVADCSNERRHHDTTIPSPTPSPPPQSFITLCVSDIDRLIDLTCIPPGMVLFSLQQYEVEEEDDDPNAKQQQDDSNNHYAFLPHLEAAAIMYNLAIADIMMANTRTVLKRRLTRKTISLYDTGCKLLQLSYRLLDRLLHYHTTTESEDLISIREMIAVTVIVLPTLLAVVETRGQVSHHYESSNSSSSLLFSSDDDDDGEQNNDGFNGSHINMSDMEKQLEVLFSTLEEIDQDLFYIPITNKFISAAAAA